MLEISQMVLTFKIDLFFSLASSERRLVLTALHQGVCTLVEHKPWQFDTWQHPHLVMHSVATVSHYTETGSLSEGPGLSSLPSTAIWVTA